MDDRRLSKRLEQQIRILTAEFDRDAARTRFAPSEWRALSVLNDTDGLSLKGLAVRGRTVLYGGRVIAVQVYPKRDEATGAAVMGAVVRHSGRWYVAGVDGSRMPLAAGPP
ncbi:hypothetical protein CQ393_10150 [Stenotrophomonas sp. MYb238]|uniref:hypothetical protein n=1 Tax=Stenotrophomonas sp. MYb238 TaxID=2040281 RepID=UPI001290E67E|nr:hypothetical protein [Stenotrophomonas sp. MYb238]MQP76254.1 hypothetical protein [Stenotrophomonas sp. MYb238]